MIACITDAWTPKDYLTILLAIIATWIAYQQWLTSVLKVQHDLYERKLAVFTALIDFLSDVVVKGMETDARSLEIRRIFLIRTRESNFLFKKESEIPDYLADVYAKAEEFGKSHVAISNDEKLSKLEQNAKIDAERKWLHDQLNTGAKDKFVEYIKLYSSWHG
jgi:hypothetical protein